MKEIVRANPDIFCDWSAEHWRRFNLKYAAMKNKGMVTSKGILFSADAVNQELPRPEVIEPAASTPTEDLMEKAKVTEPLASLEQEAYMMDIRRKFEAVLQSHHQRTVCSMIETLYRDLVFH